MTSAPTAISLFSGAMGLDLGAENAGFSVRVATDLMAEAVETARANRPGMAVLQADARELSASDLLSAAKLEGEADVLIGGPPCQSFSTAGRRMSLDDKDQGSLVFEFVRLLGELRPRAFVLENVPGLLSASVKWRRLPYNNNGKRIDDLYGSLFDELRRRILELGYSVGHAQLLAADYGVPQRRPRVFVVGYRDGSPVSFPEPTHCKGGSLLLPPWRTLRDAFSSLVDDDSPCAVFSDRKLKYLRQVPPGGNWRDLPEAIQKESMGRAFFAKGGRSGYWRRLSFDEPSPTILTEPQNASTSLCHPIEDRPLTVRECARIQTFPDEWVFHGSKGQQYRLVGNAVPVLLAETVLGRIRHQLERIACSRADHVGSETVAA